MLFASAADNLVTTGVSNGLPFHVSSPLNVFLRNRTNQSTALVSINISGADGGNGDSLPSGISADGRYALFESSAGDLVGNDTNNATDVFVRDLQAGTTVLVSATPTGEPGNGASDSAVITPDGRDVAFTSAATNLVANDTNQIRDVFVRDLQTATTVLISVGAKPTSPSTLTNSSELPGITPDGRYVVFNSTATNLVSGVTNTFDVYVRDLQSSTTTWASTNARSIFMAGGFSVIISNVPCYNQCISTDGVFVAYEVSYNPLLYSRAGKVLRYNVLTGQTDVVNTNAASGTALYPAVRSLDMTPDGRFIAYVQRGTSDLNSQIYRWDAQTGTNVLISADLNSLPPAAGLCDSPSVDPTGRYVTFVSGMTNLTTNAFVSAAYHVYQRDTQTGLTQILDANPDGTGIGVNPTVGPAVSDNARFAVFETDGGITIGDRNRRVDVFVRDTLSNATELISVAAPMLLSQTPNGDSGICIPSISADGRYVAFASEADDVVANDTNNLRDIFMRDRVTSSNILVSINTNGTVAAGASTTPLISADGNFVAFTSYADDVAGGKSGSQDLFLRDLQNQSTMLISTNSPLLIPDAGNSLVLGISPDGRYVLYRSTSRTLASGSYTAAENLVIRDRLAPTNLVLTTGGFQAWSMTAAGDLVAYAQGSPTSTYYLWSTQTATRIYTNSANNLTGIAVSSNGQYIAYLAGSPASLFMVDRTAGPSAVTITTGPFPKHPGLKFSGDSHLLLYTTGTAAAGADANITYDVYLYDLLARTNLLVSRSYLSPGAPSGGSDTPDISTDGRFIAYRSLAADVVPGDTNLLSDLFVQDRVTGTKRLLSARRSGGGTADYWSFNPIFSASGRTVVFSSGAGDLTASDLNRASDVFTIDLSADNVDVTNAADALIGVLVSAGGTPNGPTTNGPTLIWQPVLGIDYHVQFKDAIDDPAWQDSTNGVVISGPYAYFFDPAPNLFSRFYRFSLTPTP